MRKLLDEDREHILARGAAIWERFRDGRIFITGGTGFFGYWLLEALLAANAEHRLGMRIIALSRAPDAFAAKAPHLASDPAVQLVPGDQERFEYKGGPLTHVIHAAIDYGDPFALFNGVVNGTRRTLELAVRTGATKYLLTSSGAVYGRQPSSISHLPEDYNGSPNTSELSAAYGEGKRAAEFLCTCFHQKHGLDTVVSRGYAFVGPALPLDSGSAIGNFIGDALAGRPIRVAGDGSPIRSYLYGADLAVWLLTMLSNGTACRPYNVGSDVEISIAEVAHVVAEEVAPTCEVVIEGEPTKTGERAAYVPSIRRARTELALDAWIDLREAIRRTAKWYRRAITQ